MANDQRLRRFAVFVLVAGAHVLLLMLPFETERREYEERDGDEKRSQLFFPVPPWGDDFRDGPVEPKLQTNITIDVPSPDPAPLEAESTSSSVAAPAINWSEEGRRAAVAAAARVPTPDRNKCDSTGLGDPTLRNCKPPPEFKWAPPKAGFSQGLPYMRLGDRCVIGLGFFGCSLGKPPARGDLFEGMDDPDRERSSVPEPEH